MTVRVPALANRGLPTEDYRLASSAVFVPGTGLHSQGGAVAAPAGYRGEVTLLGPSAIRVNPGRWVVPGTQSGVQGDYTVTNDAAVDRTIGAQDVSLTRLDRLVVQVRDTGYVPNDAVDDADVFLLPGTPALAGATAPAVPNNALDLGVVTVPPTGGTVTFTGTVYNTQVAVGGLQPVQAGDITPGSFDGQLRHGSSGMTQWSEVDAAWTSVRMQKLRLTSTTDASASSVGHGLQVGPDTGTNLAIDGDEIVPRNNGVLATLGLGGAKLVSVGTPTAATDAATKGYADGLITRTHTWLFPRSAHTANASDAVSSGSGMITLISGTISLAEAAAGDYLLIVQLVLAGSANNQGNLRFTVDGTNVTGDARSDVLSGSALPRTFAYTLRGYNGGALAVAAAQSVAAGTYTIYTAGSFISVAYLGPR